MDGLEVVTEDIEFEGDRAWLVRPATPDPGATPMAGVLMCHWLSTEEPIGDRDEFLEEARELAGLGATCLLPQGQFPWTHDPTGTAQDLELIEAEVARLSRGLDVLAGRPDVDPKRLAVVGHDFGAMYAAILAARQDRVRAIVLMAPAPRWADWFIPFWDIDPPRGSYLELLGPLDTTSQIPQLSSRPVLIQVGKRDPFVPLMVRFELQKPSVRAGNTLLEVRSYDSGHELEAAETRADRIVFLRQHLRLG